MSAARTALEAIYAKAAALKAKAQELGLGTGGEPLLLTKWAGRAAAIVAGWAATNIPGVAGFKDVLAALLATAAVETVTDFIARSQVAPKWKVITAAVAAKAGELDAALKRAGATVATAEESWDRVRETWKNEPPQSKF